MTSFVTYLNHYCNELSGLNTRSLKIFSYSLQEHPRLKEPLLLLALGQGRESYLISKVSEPAEYKEFVFYYYESGLALEEYLETLEDTDRYKKCFNSWKSSKTKLEADRHFLVSLSRRLSLLLEEKGISRASVCREYKLNKGNFYAFLKGDTTKMSRETATRIYRLIENL